jgi:electron transfer flavoprotein alpha subunit
MKTLVLVEHEGGHIKDATLAAVTAASQLGEVHLLVAGSGVGAVAEAAAKIAGAGKVHVADAAHLEHQLAEDVAPVAAALMADHDAFLASSTTTGKNVAPRVAALLDVMQISDILSVDGEDTFTRPIYAGNAIATVKSKDAKKVITVRGTAFEKAATSTCTSPPSFAAAATVFSVAPFSRALSCSAITRGVMVKPPSLRS